MTSAIITLERLVHLKNRYEGFVKGCESTI
jgi:hypothetical protein